jgi:predicted CXXCH cytochrome family protein
MITVKISFAVAAVFMVSAAIGVASLERDPHRDLPGDGVVDCEECHRAIFEEGYMHPVGIVPRRVGIPADFPLSRAGRLTCTTCHDVTGPAENAWGGSTHYLRGGKAGKIFCDRCHGDVLALDSHRTALGEAHFQPEAPAIVPGNEIDPISKHCLTCHDGVYGSMVSLKAGPFSHGGMFALNGGNHPIGVDYEAARTMPGRKTELRPMPLVDPRILFFDGRVGCGSCHHPYSALPNNLVMVDAESRLCLACHMLDS